MKLINHYGQLWQLTQLRSHFCHVLWQLIQLSLTSFDKWYAWKVLLIKLINPMDSYGSLLNLDLIFVMSYGVLYIFKCRIQLTQLSLLTLSSPYSERPFWFENIAISRTVLFLCHLNVFGLEETTKFTYSAIPMPFKGVSLYVMSLKGQWGGARGL